MIENFRKREGHYPSRVLADKIYRNRENLSYCKECGIRLSGPALGRPRKGEQRNKAQDNLDECQRVEVERRFSLVKRKCGMGLVMAKLEDTAAHVVAMSILVLNLKKIQCAFFELLVCLLGFLNSAKKWTVIQQTLIMGIAEYLKTSISGHALHVIDRRVNDCAFSVWKRMYPEKYNEWQVPLKELSNLPHRHKDYLSKTFAIPVDDKWIGLTMAFITHVQYQKKPFNQKMTPYTSKGKKLYVNYRSKHKPLPCNRPSINTPSDIMLSVYAKGKYNFEFFMNREYAFNRDNGKCKCCKQNLYENPHKKCHHIDNKLPIDKIN